MTRIFFGVALALAAALPSEAFAQAAVFASFRAEYQFTSPLVIGPHRVKFTLYDDGTFINDDGNGGDWELAGAGGNSLTMWFINQASATASYPPVGAPTWTGTVTGSNVCNGQTRRLVYGAPPELGTWKTRGCP
jgi:hypothetical protein